MTDSADESFNDEDSSETILEEGEEVCWQDWDSGGPGAGAGRVSVSRHNGSFYVFHDAGIEGPYPTKKEAVESNGVTRITAATEAIWDEDAGYIFSPVTLCGVAARPSTRPSGAADRRFPFGFA